MAEDEYFHLDGRGAGVVHERFQSDDDGGYRHRRQQHSQHDHHRAPADHVTRPSRGFHLCQ